MSDVQGTAALCLVVCRAWSTVVLLTVDSALVHCKNLEILATLAGDVVEASHHMATGHSNGLS